MMYPAGTSRKHKNDVSAMKSKDQDKFWQLWSQWEDEGLSDKTMKKMCTVLYDYQRKYEMQEQKDKRETRGDYLKTLQESEERDVRLGRPVCGKGEREHQRPGGRRDNE